MDIVKKNMWSIVCGVVAVLSTYYPLTGLFVELDTKLQSSASEHSKFNSLVNLNPNMPVIDPKTSEVKPLGQFPTSLYEQMRETLAICLRGFRLAPRDA